MALTEKFNYSGSINDLKLRVMVYEVSFPKEKDMSSLEKTGSETLVEETVVDWVFSSSEGGNKLISYKFSESNQLELNLGKPGILMKLSGSIKKLFTEFRKTIHPVTEEHTVIERSALKFFLNDSKKTSEKNCLWTITVHENSTIQFDPPISTKGVSVHGQSGECRVILEVLEREILQNTDFLPAYKIDVSKEPSSHSLNEHSQHSSSLIYQINIERAINFDKDGIIIEWELSPGSSEILVLGRHYGRTKRCFRTKEGHHYFSELFTVLLSEPKYVATSSLTMKLRVMSEDIWGRQRLEGFTTTVLSPFLKKTEIRLQTVKPIAMARHEQLEEFFLGSLSDYEQYDHYRTTEGKIVCSYSPISHMDVPQFDNSSLKYYNIDHWRLKPSLIWKIMKVLLEFEEARSQLLTVNKPE